MITQTYNELPKAINILAVICEYANRSVNDFQERNRKREVVIFKQMFCYFATQKTTLTLDRIGKMIGVRHNEVIYGRDKTESMIFIKDDKVMPIFNDLSKILN